MVYPDDAPLPEISAEDAVARVDGGAWLLDVRERYEWATGHAPEAHLVPLSEIIERINEIPKEREVLVICHSGQRSLQVTEYLLREGRDAVNLTGGMIAWFSAGGEIVAD